MKTYHLNTVLTFGKHQGQSVKEILSHSPEYISWCIMNLDHFYISKETLESCIPGIVKDPLPEHIIKAIKEKQEAEESHEVESDYEPDPWFDNRTFNDYNGSYAQDQMGFSDQVIDDVFDGDPDLYWNID